VFGGCYGKIERQREERMAEGLGLTLGGGERKRGGGLQSSVGLEGPDECGACDRAVVSCWAKFGLDPK
jgi:hypothetical protein